MQSDTSRHALAATHRHVAFLLRLAFLESRERFAFWQDHPCQRIYVLSERPSFTGGGTDSCPYGFFIWDKWHTAPRVDPITQLEVISWR